MRIAFHARNLIGDLNKKIIELTFDCAASIAMRHSDHEFFVIIDAYSGKQNLSSNLTLINPSSEIKTSISKQLCYNYKLPSLLKKNNIDVLVNMDGVCSLRTKVKQCLFINGISFKHNSEFFLKNDLRFLKKFTTSSLQKANTIITTSNVVKKDILELYKTEESKIDMVRVGMKKNFKPIEEKSKVLIKEKYCEGKEFFLYTGSLNGINNLITLLKAFSFFKKRLKSNMQLIIATTSSLQNNSFIKDLETYKYRNEVKLLENPADEDLAGITASAYAFIYPSYFENSGMYVLNAIKCETPVITANTAVFKELFEDAVLSADPASHEDIANKMIALFNDENGRNLLIEKGKKLTLKYDWDKTMEQWWQIILKTAKS